MVLETKDDSLDMMMEKPSFSFPRRFSAGTSTSSNSIYVEARRRISVSQIDSIGVYCPSDVPLAFTPEFGIFLQVTPFTFMGMMSAETPFAPSPPVRTAAIV